MANLKISQLTAGNPAQSGDEIPIARSGANFSVTAGSIAALTASPPTLETNGVSNSTQSLLNIAQGTGMSVSESGGTVTITNTDPSFAGFSTAGSAFFAGGQNNFIPLTFSGGGPANSTGANIVSCCLLMLLAPYTVNSCNYYQVTGTGSGGFLCCAIYSFDGNTKLVDAGTNAFSLNASLQSLSTTFTPVTLPAGSYWFAWGATATSIGSGIVRQGSAHYMDVINKAATKFGQATNSISSGTMPSSLGVITAYTNAVSGSTLNIPEVLFQV